MWAWLTSFVMNPALAVGTAAVASPILIHLLSRRRFRRVRWAAMDFLLDAQRRNRRRIKIEQLILLLLRCLALFLLAMVMMRPFLRPSALAGLTTVGRSEHIILLDDSFSMGYRSPSGAGAGQSVFAHARQAVQLIAQRATQDRISDSLTLLTTSRPRQPLIALSSLSEANLRQLYDHLELLAPSQSAARFHDAFSAIRDMIRSAPTQANVVVYVISDFQRHDWLGAEGSDEKRDRSPAAPLAELDSLGRRPRLVLVDTALDVRPQNVAITELRRDQAQVVAGIPTRFEVEVANYSPNDLSQIELSIRAGEGILPPVAITSLASGQVAREPIEVTFPVEGSSLLSVKLLGATQLGDGLALDNERIVPVEVVSAVKVLIVNGKPSGDPYNDEVYLLRTALRPAGRVASGIDIEVIDEQDIEGVDLDGYAVVILANVDRFSTGAVRKLEAFAASGGGLIFFAGDQLDATSYNDQLHRGGVGLLPAALGEPTDAPPGMTVNIDEWDTTHPVLRTFVEELATVLRGVRVVTYMKLADPVEATSNETVPTPDEGTGTSTAPANDRPGPRILIRLNDSDRSPLMVERAFGRGSCTFIATSADLEWTDWASNFSYLPMMLELVQYAARPAPTPPVAVVGAPLRARVDGLLFKPQARLRTPAFPVEAEVPLTGRRDGDEIVFELEAAQRCGAYEFTMTTMRDESVTRYAAVNPEAAESNLTRSPRTELEATLSEFDFQYVEGIGGVTGQASAARIEIWWPLLIAAIVLFMTEHTLAWWFGTRG